MKCTRLGNSCCLIAHSLDVIGDWWSLLIVRNVLRRVCRLSEFQKNLGIAKNMLAGRLKMLVDEGILCLQSASDGSTQQEYVLTDKGRALQTVLVALSQWVDDYPFEPDKPATRLIDHQRRQPLRKLILQAADGRELVPADIAIAIPLNDQTLPAAGKNKEVRTRWLHY